MLERTPALSHHGFGLHAHSNASQDEALAIFEQGRQKLLNASEICSEICQQFTGIRHTSKINRRAHSLALKGLFECSLGKYVSEGEFILAAIHAGYRWERDGPSALFAMAIDDLELIRQGLPPSRPYDWW